jgi:hypothetical protein
VGHHVGVTDQRETLTLSWTPRPAEFADAYHARLQDVGGARRPLRVAVILAVFAGLTILLPHLALTGLLMGAFALFLAWFRVGKTLVRRQSATLFAANQTLGETRTTTFGPAGLSTDAPRTSSTWSWSAFTSWSDTPHAVVVSTGDIIGAMLVVVPHRATSGSEQVTALRTVVERHLGPALGSGPRRRLRWQTWAGRSFVVACLLLPLWVTVDHVHDQGDEWRLSPSEAPPRVTLDGVDYTRTGKPTTTRPQGTYGDAYTPGGGLIIRTWPTPAEPDELWVLDHANVVHHYVVSATPTV